MVFEFGPLKNLERYRDEDKVDWNAEPDPYYSY